MKKIKEKEKNFKEKQLALDLKAKEKKNLKKEKYLKRSKFWKSPTVILLRWFIRFIIIITLILIGLHLKDLYNNYNNSKKWTEEKSAPLATIPPELLYSNAKDKKQQLDFIKIQSEIWDEKKLNFKENVTQDKINNLITKYQAIKTNKQYLKENYIRIIELWSVKKEMDTIIIGDTITDKKSLVDIQNFVNKKSPIINKYLLKDRDKALFAKQVKKIMKNLAFDVSQINLILESVNNNTIINSRSIVFLPEILPGAFNDVLAYKTNLIYNWEILDNKILPLIKKSEPILKVHQNELNQYNLYQKDIANKNNFNKYLIEYKASESFLNKNIIDLKSFIGKDINELRKWANKNYIVLKIKKEESSKPKDEILSQMPDTDIYEKIFKGSVLEVTIAKKIIKPVTTEEPTTEEVTTEDATTEESSTEEPVAEENITEESNVNEVTNEENNIEDIVTEENNSGIIRRTIITTN